MNTKRLKTLILLTSSFVIYSACSDFLDMKPDQRMAVPETLQDFQALLDNTQVMNVYIPALGEETTDNWHLSTDRWLALDVDYRNNYCFNNTETRVGMWTVPYRAIYYSNLALEGIENYHPTATGNYEKEHIAGAAYFYRAYAHYHLAQMFAPAYRPGEQNTAIGIVLRRRSSVDEPLHRATVAETYESILEDLQKAAAMLPLAQQTPTRPSRPAAWAMLSRIHLFLANYDKALAYADTALSHHYELMEYADLDTLSNAPFTRHNVEVIYQSQMTTIPMAPSRANIDSALYESYETDDLRKALYFRTNTDGTYRFKGGYDGMNGTALFNGITTGELYLTKAECLSRSGNVEDALLTLNNLLHTRWSTGTFLPTSASATDDALNIILTERRKELLYRGLRWPDLRRLAVEGRFTAGVYREVDGIAYELTAQQIPDYVYRIPEEAVEHGDYLQN